MCDDEISIKIYVKITNLDFYKFSYLKLDH